ncbi:MAG: hypothetical protein VKJ06_09490 [Vampirovibrionales bacterium]|nr:hypothetical protein [Vampirovibrionales bacterium]
MTQLTLPYSLNRSSTSAASYAPGNYTYPAGTQPVGLWVTDITISGVTSTGLTVKNAHLLPQFTQLDGFCNHGIQFKVNA